MIISKENLARALSENYNVTELPKLESILQRFPSKFRITASRVNGNYPELNLNNEYIFLFLRPMKYVFRKEEEIDSHYLLYNILMFMLKVYKYDKNRLTMISDYDLLFYSLVYFYYYISEDEESELEIRDIMLPVLDLYNRLKTVTNTTKILERIINQSIENGPFDYMTDGVNIYEIIENERPF